MKLHLPFWLEDLIMEIVVRRLQAGGWCGLCGNWCPETFVDIAYPYVLCAQCAKDNEDEIPKP